MTMLILLLLMMIMYLYNTPISSILILISITLIISLKIFNFSYSSWLPLIIFLMMVGGMLILFIYMASISPNKKFIYKSKLMLIKLMLSCFMLNFYLPQNNLLHSLNSPNLIFSMMNNISFMIFSICYLFVFLFMISLILKKKSGPLRSF